MEETERSLKEHQERTARIEAEFDKKKKQVEEHVRRKIQEVVDEQNKEIAELQTEFGNASSLMDQKYKQLNARFQELQELYDDRPPRPEDLELIKKLQDEIETKDAAIKKAAEDMKFYKLELINREESYN